MNNRKIDLNVKIQVKGFYFNIGSIYIPTIFNFCHWFKNSSINVFTQSYRNLIQDYYKNTYNKELHTYFYFKKVYNYNFKV